jgi:hypothetical protein
MKNFTNILKSIHQSDLTLKEVSILIELLCTKIDINTISGMARSENKTPRGIKISNNYKKIKIGDSVLCIKGVKNNNLPF